MATRIISQSWRVEGVLTDVTTAKMSDPTGAYGIKRNDLSASTISGGTKADPVVITTSAAHGLSDGQMVNFLDMVGMTDLEGLNYYAKVTGQSATSYALYQETGLTNTVDGSGFVAPATSGTATPAEVADGTAMTSSTAGVYQYSFDDTANIAYTSYVEFVYGGATYHFEVDLAARTVGSIASTYSDLRTEIADFLGWTRGGDWSNDESERLDSVINAGYRQFIYPPVAPGETVSYRWSFLRPTATFDTVDGTYLYDMPAAFGAMVGDLVYDEDEDVHRIIEQTTPGMIDRNRAVDSLADGRPYLFALRPKGVAQTAEQTTEIMLFPSPDAAYGIIYHYDAKVDVLSSVNAYPLGGQAHSETLMQSCRDIAATRYRDDPMGREHALYLERLKASIESDRRLSPKTLGMNNDGQRTVYTRHGTEFSVTHGSMP